MKFCSLPQCQRMPHTRIFPKASIGISVERDGGQQILANMKL